MNYNLDDTRISEKPAGVKPVAIYCRVSTDNQENEGTSLDTQRAACLKYCQQHGYTVTHQFIETWSGLSLERPKLDELRHLVRNEQITAVIVHSLDRLSRDPTHGVILQEELEKHHVSLEAVTETVESTDLGKLISYIRGYAAKLEAEKIRERTMRGTKARVFDKKLPITYREPFGYTWDRTGERPKLVPNDDYDTVKLILNLAIEGKSYDFIIAELKRRGIQSPAGLAEWNKHTISTIIRNPVYAGLYYAFKSEVATPKKRNGNSYGKSSVKRLPQNQWHHIPEIEVIDPPMTLDQRALLLDQLEKRQKLSSRNAKREYLLRGMILCETHKGVNGKPRIYHGQPHHKSWRYTCPVGGDNDTPYIHGPWIEEWLKSFLMQFFTFDADWLFQEVFASHNQRSARDELNKEQGTLEAELNKLTIKMARLEDGRLEGNIGNDEYQILKTKYTARRQQIKERQDYLLDQVAALSQGANALKAWEDLKYRFLDRMLIDGMSKAEIDFFQKHHPLTDQPGEPLTFQEWRLLLTQLNFRWIVGIEDNPNSNWVKRFGRGKSPAAKLLRRSRLSVDLPLKQAIEDIALHTPAPG